MPWWGWLAGALAVLAVAALGCSAGVRRSSRGRAFLALRSRQKLRFGRALWADRSVPPLVRLALALLVGYLLLPFDIVPDFLPVIGQLDDLLVIALVVGIVLMATPAERIDAALAVARGDG